MTTVPLKLRLVKDDIAAIAAIYVRNQPKLTRRITFWLMNMGTETKKTTLVSMHLESHSLLIRQRRHSVVLHGYGVHQNGIRTVRVIKNFNSVIKWLQIVGTVDFSITPF